MLSPQDSEVQSVLTLSNAGIPEALQGLAWLLSLTCFLHSSFRSSLYFSYSARPASGFRPALCWATLCRLGRSV